MSSGNTTVGEIAYKIKIDTKDFKGEISRVERAMKTDLGSAGDKSGKEAGKKASSGFGEKLKAGLKNIGAGFLGGIGASISNKIINGIQSAFSGAIGVVKSSISSFGDYEQLIGGVETLFKDSAGIVEGYANNAYKTAGLSANAYMETVTGFSASLLQSLGGDTAAAAKVGDMAIRDMADNANKMGTSMQSIQNAYQGFAKQNYTMLDNLKLGYGGTKEEMLRLLADAEKISGIKYNINNLSDVYNAIHVIQEKLDITGTTAKEAGSTLQGSAASMKSAWENLLTGMANPNADFGGLIDKLMDSFSTFMDNLLPIAERALNGFVKMITQLAPKLAEMLPKVLPGIIEGIVLVINALIEVLPDILKAILPPLVMGIGQILLALVEMLPDLLIVLMDIIFIVVEMLTKPESLTMLLNAGMTLLMGLINAMPVFLNRLVEALPQIITNILQFLLDPNTIAQLLSAGVALFMALVRSVPMIFGALLGALGGLFAEIWKRVSGMFKDGGKAIGQAFSGAFKGAINNILGVVEGTVNFFINMINGVIGIINAIPGVNIGKLNTLKIPRLASGGIVPATAGGHIIMAGEAGEDEWVVPESKMASLIQKLSESGAGGGGDTFNFTFNGVIGTKSELRQCAITFHDAYEEVKRSRMVA